MSADPSGDEEAEGEALAALLGAVEAGDPLTLTLDPSDAPLVDASTRTVRRWVKRYADEAADTFDDDGWRDLSAHDFRRTWATLLAGAEDVDPLLVCQWGGWEDLETFLEHYRGAYSPEVQRRARDGVEWL